MGEFVEYDDVHIEFKDLSASPGVATVEESRTVRCPKCSDLTVAEDIIAGVCSWCLDNNDD